MKDFMKLDLYLLLNIKSNASVTEIKKAYRKKALICHPDKNPGNPKALEDFKQLSKAVEILTNAVTRADYDKILRERKLENAKRIFERSPNERDYPNRKQPKMSVPKWPPSFATSQGRNEQSSKQNTRRDSQYRKEPKRPVPTWPPSASKAQPKRGDFSRPNSNFKYFYSSILKPATFIPPSTNGDSSNNNNNQFDPFGNNQFPNATFNPPPSPSNNTSSGGFHSNGTDFSWRNNSSILKPATFIPPSKS